MRVLWLTENYPPSPGGMAHSCDRIVYGLGELGVEVDLVHLTRRGREPSVEARRCGRLLLCPVGEDPAHALNRLWSLLESSPERKELTHVVAFGGALPLLAAPVLAAWLRLPLLTLLRGNDFDVAVFSSSRRETLREALVRSAAVRVVSRDKLEKVSSLYPQVAPVWIPNGIDLSSWELVPSDRRRAAEWRVQSVAPGRRVLGMFGQLKRKKGGLFFLEVLLLSGLAGRFHLLLVGEVEAEMREWLEAHAAEVPHSLVPFVGRYELLPWYAACDLVVIPSFYDGLPNVLLEAGGLGIPPLASRAGGMGDVLVHGQHGLLFPPGDTHECRKTIELAAHAPAEELLRLGAECRTMVRQELGARLEAERYRAVLEATSNSGGVL